jgi:hypothetical protein
MSLAVSLGGVEPTWYGTGCSFSARSDWRGVAQALGYRIVDEAAAQTYLVQSFAVI